MGGDRRETTFAAVVSIWLAASCGARPTRCATERSLWRLDAAGTVSDGMALDGVPTAVAADGDRRWMTLRAA